MYNTEIESNKQGTLGSLRLEFVNTGLGVPGSDEEALFRQILAQTQPPMKLPNPECSALDLF